MKVFTASAKKQIKGNHLIIGRLMAHLNKSELTINRMVDNSHERLTAAMPLAIIREELAIGDSEILEEEKEPVPGVQQVRQRA